MLCCVTGIVSVLLAICCLGGGATITGGCLGFAGFSGISIGGTTLGVFCSTSGIGFVCYRLCKKRKRTPTEAGEIQFAESQDKDPNLKIEPAKEKELDGGIESYVPDKP